MENIMKPDAVIFDIDGTLTNSIRPIAASWNRYLASLHIPCTYLTEELAASLMGKTMDEWAMAVLPDLPLTEARRHAEIMEQEENEEIRTNGTDLYPGVYSVFESLHKNYDLFILSNCGKGYIEAVAAYAGIEPFLKGHLCYGDTMKDKPENLRLMCERYHLERPVYIGDTDRDRECCEEAGMPFIFVSWGFGDVPGAKLKADAMEELPSLIPLAYE